VTIDAVCVPSGVHAVMAFFIHICPYPGYIILSYLLVYTWYTGIVAGATQVIAGVNKAVDPAQVMKTMNQFTMEMDKMETAQESWEDLMDVFDGDGIEEESDAVVGSVLDELGISMGQQLDAAGVVPQDQARGVGVPAVAPPSVYQFPTNPAANPSI